MFRAGEKVVCVRADWNWDASLPPWRRVGPKANEDVTIERVYQDPAGVYLILEEYHPQTAYDSSKFRKLHDETVRNILNELRKQPVELQ